MSEAPLLELRGLTKHYPLTRGALRRRRLAVVHAVDGVTLDLARGETLGLVGETGSGKTTLARLVAGLERPTAGSVRFHGDPRRDVQMVFQDPQGSLNPRKTVGSIIAAPLEIHRVGEGRAGRRRMVQELMERVGLEPGHYNRYPHEFSGGQRQRVGIARALALRPRLVIADEPVSALDVSIQAQILELLRELQAELGIALLLISHDLSVVRHMCDRVAVMYLGAVVELARSDDLYAHPRHPYTGALMAAIPVPDPSRPPAARRHVLGGEVPSPTDPPPACRFHTRCPKRQELCTLEEPPLEPKRGGNLAACHFPLD